MKTAVCFSSFLGFPIWRSVWRACAWRGVCGLVLGSMVALGMPSSANSTAATQSSELRVTGMTYVASRGSLNLYRVQASDTRVDPVKEVATLVGVHVVMSPDSEQSFEFHCARGEIELATGNFRAEGQVHGLTADKRRFSTEWVSYDNKAHAISTTAVVLIEDIVGKYRGKKGFRYFVDREHLELFEPEVIFGP